MAQLGFKTFNEMIGRVDKIDTNHAVSHWKTKSLDFSKLFYKPEVGDDIAIYNTEKQKHPIDNILDKKLIPLFEKYLVKEQNQVIELDIKNTDRTTGAMLSGKIAARKGHSGLKDNSLKINFTGTAGQSFGAFLARGVTFKLHGEANDYVGKGLSGGKLIIRPVKNSKIISENSMVIGNTVLYGAISGECYFNGIAGERYCVRNSGAISVIEGLGDHGCEYMTGGIVLCLGAIGRNFAAGMSGGIAYVFDPEDKIKGYLNTEMVNLEDLDISGNSNSEYDNNFNLSENLLIDDDLRIRFLIDKHIKYTDSNLAKNIVNNWNNNIKYFKKIMPIDYKKVLIENEKNNTKIVA